MKLKNLSLLILIFAISYSCTDDMKEIDQNNYDFLMSDEVSALPDEFEEGWIRVKFSGLSDNQLRSDNRLSDKAFQEGFDSASGIKELDELAEILGATQVRRVFAEGGKYKERRRAAGLHLWYDFYVGEGMPPVNNLRSSAYPGYVDIVELIPVFRQTSEPSNSAWRNNLRASQAIPTTKFNDPLLGRQWHYQNDGSSSSQARVGADINLFSAWEITTGHPNVIVAVMDGGVDYEHPDLAQNIWINTKEYNGTSGNDDDDNGYVDDIYGYRWGSSSTAPGGGDIKPMDHGTHCAGTIGAVNNNGVGIGGVAGGNGSTSSGVRIMSCQTYVPDPEKPEDPYGNSKSTSQTPDAFAYAADNGAVIVNCSFSYGGTSLSAAYKAGIDYFVDNAGKYPGSPMKGGLVVAAAGNDGQEITKYPGAYERCISVAYMTSDFKKSSSSNFGSWVNITAPGGATSSSYAPNKVGGVLSTAPMKSGNYDVQQGYSYKSGTSMAAPHIAGVAALIVSAMVENGVKDFTLDQLWNILLMGTRNIDQYNPDYAGKLGVGYCDARLALDFALGNELDIPGVEVAIASPETDKINLRWKVPAGLRGDAPKSFIVLLSESSLDGVNTDNPGEKVKKIVVENNKPVDQYNTCLFEDLKPGTLYHIGIASVYKDNMKSKLYTLTSTTNPSEGGDGAEVTFVLTLLNDNRLYIQATQNTTSPAKLKIFNAIGNRVLEKEIMIKTEMTALADLSKLSSGVYTAIISYGGKDHQHNIFKN